VRQDFIKFLIRELTRFKMSSHQISNVTNNWMYIPVHVYHLHDLQKKQLSLHKSFMGGKACSYLIYSTYNLVNPIYEPHTEFLGFSRTVNGCITFLKFMVLPFGLSTACYLFTKLNY
jgi:hypothetical protein